MSSNKDIFPPELIKERGSIHPINNMKDSIMSLLESFGFEIIDGPEIETEEFNFDMQTLKRHILLDRCMTLFMLKKIKFTKNSHFKKFKSDVRKRSIPLFLVVKFTEKMMMLLICQCFIR